MHGSAHYPGFAAKGPEAKTPQKMPHFWHRLRCRGPLPPCHRRATAAASAVTITAASVYVVRDHNYGPYHARAKKYLSFSTFLFFFFFFISTCQPWGNRRFSFLMSNIKNLKSVHLLKIYQVHQYFFNFFSNRYFFGIHKKYNFLPIFWITDLSIYVSINLKWIWCLEIFSNFFLCLRRP